MPEFLVFLRKLGCLELLFVEEHLTLVGNDGAVSDNESLKILESEQQFEDDASQRHAAQIKRLHVGQKGWKCCDPFVRDLVPT